MSGWLERWFGPEPARAYGVFRIAYGLVLLWWAGSFAVDAVLWFSDTGFGRLGLPAVEGGGPVLAILAVGGVGFAGCGLALDRFVRASAGLAFTCLSVLIWANPAVMNTGERLLVIYAVVLAVAPLVERGTQLAWPRLAIQWQMCAVYGLTVASKLKTPVWRNGEALEYALGLEIYRKAWVPDEFLRATELLQVASYATLVVQTCLAVLVWNRRLRPYVLAAGVGLHVSIEASMHVGMFSVAILLPYLLFWLHRDVRPGDVPADTGERGAGDSLPAPAGSSLPPVAAEVR